MPNNLSEQLDFGIKNIAVENLFLDPDNPRLAKPGSRVTDIELLEELYRRYDLKDVLLSLAQHGYFSEEPLIAVPKPDNNAGAPTEYIVVEGNRRLAALKLLLSDNLRKQVGAKNIPTPASEAVIAKLRKVPVKIYQTRAEIIAYLGVRHITGIKPWDSQAKAKYVYSLVKEGHSISEVTKMVASRSDIVARGLLSLYVLNQANKIADKPWEEQTEGFSFSFIYTALEYNSVRKYLGLTTEITKNPKPNPVPQNCVRNLLDCMFDLYGSPDGSKPPKLVDSRDISKLAAIYDTAEALDYLRAGATLIQAYRKSGGEQAELIDLLREASHSLDEADGIVSHIDKSPDAIKWAKRCFESANRIYKTLSKE